MGKIVMPKNSALLNEIEAVLKIYYEANDWLSNDIYKAKLKEIIGDDQYSSSYTKKGQITSYFGFTIWEDISNPQSMRKITESGKKMYEAIRANNSDDIQKILMESLEKTTFGRNNFGCPDSNSDVEPPALFIRASLDLGYLTYKEFAYLLWKLEDVGGNYTDTILEIRNSRNNLDPLELGEEANKYTDCKPIMILVRWGFLTEDDATGTFGGRHIKVKQEVLDKYFNRLKALKIYNIDMDYNDEYQEINESVDRAIGGENVILYGVPGAGKSWTIKNEYCSNDDLIERLVFHPDYTYSDFVGQILPQLDENSNVSYKFTPGPFTKILKKAYRDPSNHYYLVIEEVNRGNAPAIFGDVFQLLDRNGKGASEYSITNSDVATEVYGDANHKVSLPSNLSILGTMNTSDQNVFTLDTAFQRRWSMRLIENKFDKNSPSDVEFANTKILDTEVTWEKFFTEINSIILNKNIRMTSSEDKRLGTHFIQIEDLIFDEYEGNDSRLITAASKHNRKFAEKVLKYLWDDAFKFNKDEIFDIKEMNSLEKVISTFMGEKGNKRFEKILKQNIYDALVPKQLN